jgi:hypothetical protein
VTEQVPLLRNVQVFACSTCRGKGHIRNRTCHDCQGRRVVIIQGGRVVKLISTPREREERQADAQPKNSARQLRQENATCRVCGSPNLTTRYHCAEHAKEASERSARSNRNAREQRLTGQDAGS